MHRNAQEIMSPNAFDINCPVTPGSWNTSILEKKSSFYSPGQSWSLPRPCQFSTEIRLWKPIHFSFFTTQEHHAARHHLNNFMEATYVKATALSLARDNWCGSFYAPDAPLHHYHLQLTLPPNSIKIGNLARKHLSWKYPACFLF